MKDIKKLAKETKKETAEIGSSKETNYNISDNVERQALNNVTMKTRFFRLSDFIYNSFTRIEDRYRGKLELPGIPSGFPSLDIVTGGLQRQSLIIIASRPSVGKTVFAHNIAEHIAIKERKPVGFITLEMSKEQLFERMLCAEAKVDMKRIKTGYLRDEDWSKLTEAYSTLYEAPIYIYDYPGMTLDDIRMTIQELVTVEKVEIVFIDYLQLIKVKNADNRFFEISQITRELKSLAKELDVPIVVLSQLSRAVERRDSSRSPVLSDLGESGSIEQDADVVIFLSVPDEDVENEVEVVVAKNRNGFKGRTRLVFLRDYLKFIERFEY